MVVVVVVVVAVAVAAAVAVAVAVLATAVVQMAWTPRSCPSAPISASAYFARLQAQPAIR